MKTLLALVYAFAFLLPSRAGDGFDRRPPADCLKIVRGIDGSATDRSFLAQSPTIVGTVTFTSRELYFDGTDDYIHYPDLDALSFTDGSGTDRPFSIVAWVNLDSTTGTRTILCKEDYDGSGKSEYNFAITSGRVLGVVAAANGNAGKVRSGLTTTLGTATWYHVAMTYSGSETLAGIKLYVNGVEEASYLTVSDTTMNGMSNTSAKLYLGINSGTQGTNYYDFKGRMNDVILINRELTAAEIGGIYAEGRP